MNHQITESKNRISFFAWMTVLLFSVITGFSLSSVVVTDGNIEKFYNGGETWTIPSNQITSALSNIYYEPHKDEFMIVKDQAQILLDSSMKNIAWKYFEVYMYDISEDYLDVIFHYYNRKDKFLGSESIQLLKGENLIEFTTDDISYIVAEFKDQTEVTFSFDKFRLMTRNYEINIRKLMIMGALFSLICFIIAGVCLAWFFKKSLSVYLYAPVVGLQKIYIKFGKIVPASIYKMNPEKKHQIRIVIFMLLFLLQTACNVFDFFLRYKYHRYVIIAICVLLLCLAFLSIEDRLKMQNWKNPLAISWFILWCMACISDFAVAKRRPMFSFNGYIIIFFVGFLFFVWNQKEDKMIFWKEICRAIEGTFFLAVLFCLFCRPESEGFRYNGAYTNPNPFGLYLAVTGCIFLCEFEQAILNRQIRPMYVIIFCSCMAAVTFFLRKTKCMTAIMALFVVFAFWIWSHLKKNRYKGVKGRFFAVLLLTVVLYIPVSYGLQWGIDTLPYKFDTVVTYPKDLQYAKNEDKLFFTGDVVYAGEAETEDQKRNDASYAGSHKNLNTDFLNIILSGRITNFTAYLQNMNLFGHRSFPNVYGASSKYAHNGILAYAYTYGIYTVIPYILMHVSFLYYALLYWRDQKEKHGFSYLPLSVGLVFFLENMMDNVDIPFHWIVWFVFLFVAGTFFNNVQIEKGYERKL